MIGRNSSSDANTLLKRGIGELLLPSSSPMFFSGIPCQMLITFLFFVSGANEYNPWVNKAALEDK
jgi:hypothetical protein